VFVLDISSASLHIPLAPTMSYSNHCCRPVLCGFWSASCSCNLRVLFYLSACFFQSQASLLIQRQVPQEHIWYSCMHNSEGQGIYDMWGETWAPGGWEPMSKRVPVPFLGQKVLYPISYSFSGFPWNPATSHHSRGPLHYPLSLHWLQFLPCFPLCGLHPWSWAPTYQ